MFRFNRLFKPVTLLLAASTLLAGCASTNPPTPSTGTITDFCAAWSPITYSAQTDSVATINQIIANNTRWTSLCAKPAKEACTGKVHC